MGLRCTLNVKTCSNNFVGDEYDKAGETRLIVYIKASNAECNREI